MADEALVVIKRNELGQFIEKPPNAGMKKGGFKRVTSMVKAQLAEELEKGGTEGNPLIILLKIARTSKDDSIRSQAAYRLCKMIMPQLIEMQEAELDEESVVTMKRITATIQRSLTEQRLLPAPEAE